MSRLLPYCTSLNPPVFIRSAEERRGDLHFEQEIALTSSINFGSKKQAKALRGKDVRENHKIQKTLKGRNDVAALRPPLAVQKVIKCLFGHAFFKLDIG